MTLYKHKDNPLMISLRTFCYRLLQLVILFLDVIPYNGEYDFHREEKCHISRKQVQQQNKGQKQPLVYSSIVSQPFLLLLWISFKKNVLWASFSNPKDKKICASFSLIFFCVYHASYNKIGNLHFFFTCFVASGIVGKY